MSAERYGAEAHLTMALTNEGVNLDDANAAADGLVSAYLRTGSAVILRAVAQISEQAAVHLAQARKDGVRQ